MEVRSFHYRPSQPLKIIPAQVRLEAGLPHEKRNLNGGIFLCRKAVLGSHNCFAQLGVRFRTMRSTLEAHIRKDRIVDVVPAETGIPVSSENLEHSVAQLQN